MYVLVQIHRNRMHNKLEVSLGKQIFVYIYKLQYLFINIISTHQSNLYYEESSRIAKDLPELIIWKSRFLPQSHLIVSEGVDKDATLLPRIHDFIFSSMTSIVSKLYRWGNRERRNEFNSNAVTHYSYCMIYITFKFFFYLFEYQQYCLNLWQRPGDKKNRINVVQASIFAKICYLIV